jgi:histidinol-phosphate aminotransferase
LVITQTFSKAFGLAGLRLGYIVSNEKIIKNLKKVTSPYSVNSLAIIAASAALEDLDFVENYVKEVRESKILLKKELERLGIKTYPSEANFLMIDFGGERKRNFVYKKLRDRWILVRRVDYPLLKKCLRIGIGTREQTILLINELKDILREKILLFDMDGVLVDVSKSYRLSIKKTAEYFTKQKISFEEIQELKEMKNYNNDWNLTEKIISQKKCQNSEKEGHQKIPEILFRK